MCGYFLGLVCCYTFQVICPEKGIINLFLLVYIEMRKQVAIMFFDVH